MFLEQYGKYDVSSDGFAIYQCYTAMWLNEFDLYPKFDRIPSKQYVPLLIACVDPAFVATLKPGHDDLIESLQKMLDYSRTL